MDPFLEEHISFWRTDIFMDKCISFGSIKLAFGAMYQCLEQIGLLFGVFKGSVFRDAVFFSKGSLFGLLKQLLILKEC